MKKEIIKKFANSSLKAKAKRIYKNITTEEATAALQEEITALEQLIEEVEHEPDDSEKLKAMEVAIEDLKKTITAISEKITEIKTTEIEEEEETFENGRQAFQNAIKEATKVGLTAGQTIAKIRFANQNNTNFNVPYIDDEITIEDRPLPSFLEACRQIPTSGETSVIWNEVQSGNNLAAVVAIGAQKPVKTNVTSASTAGAETLAEIVKLPVQFKNAAPLIQDIFEKDLSDDVNDKVNSQVMDVIVAANQTYNGTPIVGGALWQAIVAAGNSVRMNKPSSTVYVWIANTLATTLDTLTNSNGTPLSIDFEQKGIKLRTFVPSVQYPATHIFASMEGKIRFYNDGLSMSTSEHAYWNTNELGLKAEYLNEVIVLRGSDLTNVMYDEITNIIPASI